MPGLDDAAIARLTLRVIDSSLPKPEWTHEGHFAAALWLTRHRPALTQPAAIRRIITRYNAATGTANTDTGGYHHTITLASMRAAADHLSRASDDAPLAGLLATLMASRLGRPDWLLAHWRHETLFGIQARRGWVAPDIAPLPFA